MHSGELPESGLAKAKVSEWKRYEAFAISFSGLRSDVRSVVLWNLDLPDAR